MERESARLPKIAVCLCSVALCGQLTEEQFQTDIEGAVCSAYEMCTNRDCNQKLYQAVDTLDCDYDDVAAQDCVDGWEALGCDDLFNGLAPSECADVYNCPGCDPGDDISDAVARISAGLTGERDTLCDKLDTDVNRDPTTLGNPDWGMVDGSGDEAEFFGVASTYANWTVEDLDQIDAFYSCGGPGINGWTECVDPQGDLPPGDYVILTHALEGNVPLMDPTQFYQYGFVFDADGNPDNNFQAMPPFTGDFWDDTDQWYALQYAPQTGWLNFATDATNGDLGPLDSDARIIIFENTMTLIVPENEFTTVMLRFRVTVHSHLGDFGQEDPTTADTEPPVGEEKREVGEEPSGAGGGPGAGGAGGGSGAGAEGDSGCGCKLYATRSTDSAAGVVVAFLFVLLALHRARRRLGTR